MCVSSTVVQNNVLIYQKFTNLHCEKATSAAFHKTKFNIIVNINIISEDS